MIFVCISCCTCLGRQHSLGLKGLLFWSSLHDLILKITYLFMISISKRSLFANQDEAEAEAIEQATFVLYRLPVRLCFPNCPVLDALS